MESKETIAYFLQHVLGGLGDLDCDASVVKFPLSDEIPFADTRDLDLPETVYFEAAFHVIEKKDYVFTDVGWPVMSKKMLAVLKSVGNSPSREIPIVMLDDSVNFDKRFDGANKPLPGVANYDYIALQLLEHSDVFDWEQSVYEKHWFRDKLVDDIEKLVLKEPAESFPPIFRIAPCFTYLFISPAAKDALERAGCRGFATLPSNEFDDLASTFVVHDS